MKKALSFDDVIGLSIGTRTDCVTDEILDFLYEKSKQKEIWIEYGIQSFFQTTLDKINRADDVENMRYWIRRTKKKRLKCLWTLDLWFTR